MNSLGGPGKGTPSRVGQRGVAEGLGGIGEIVKVEVARGVDARLAVGQVQGQGLALLDVAQH